METHDIRSLGEYHGHVIRINPADDMYVSATDMAKACGREWADYNRLKQTGEFLAEMESALGIPRTQLVISRSTGPYDQRGTWVHRHVAIDFAQWLSPQFKVYGIHLDSDRTT